MTGRATRLGPAQKGSRYCLQQYVALRGEDLGQLIISASPKLKSSGAKNVRWLSPLATANYVEYRDDFLNAFGLQEYVPMLRSFWPLNGPQWDGLATADLSEGQAILLVEAKAHPGEIQSSCAAKNAASIGAIHRALAEVQSFMGVERCDWTKGAYQLANRLAFLYFLQVKCGVPTFLVLVNFVDDFSYKPTSLSRWAEFPLSSYLGLSPTNRLVENIVMVNPKAI